MTSNITYLITANGNNAVAPNTATSAAKLLPHEAVKGEELPVPVQDLPQDAPQKKVSDANIDDAVNDLNAFAQVIRRELNFSVDDASGRTVITVRDSETDKVIRQVPSEEILTLARNVRERLENNQEESAGMLLETEG